MCDTKIIKQQQNKQKELVTMALINKDLVQTKNNMLNTFVKTFERAFTIDILMNKSKDIEERSKDFFKINVPWYKRWFCCF